MNRSKKSDKGIFSKSIWAQFSVTNKVITAKKN